ncbi:MAG TPA: hypothetical protein VJY62_03985, partial [Bacteroidia bacterium]|nr:hypothetical protein [Bacteroidia bacterium]
DYSIEEPKVKSAIKEIPKRGFFNGLHKSASETNFTEEIKSLEAPVISNRYHYLKFNPHKDFKKIESSGIKLDSSLGFAEMYGFRNNYGMPYRPFDLTEKRTLDFVECPLNVMDGTFFNYQKINATKTYSLIEEFIRTNKSGCIISVLFHNPFITEFKFGEYRQTYIKLLEFFNRENFKCITQEEIIESFFK